jgi:hypothetical protein
LLGVAVLAGACSEPRESPTQTNAGGATSTASTGPAGAGGAAGGPGVAGAAGSATFGNLGVCGRRGRATVTSSTFRGTEELYLVGEEGFGDELCVVSYDVTRVGSAPMGCDQNAGRQETCVWTHQVEFGEPRIDVDVGAACAASELGLGEAALAALAGTRVAYGFVSEYQGHASVLLGREAASGSWIPVGNASWDAETGALRFDRRDGFCGY